MDPYLPTEDEIQYMTENDVRSDKMRLNFILQLKTFQKLHYFTKLTELPKAIINKVVKALDMPKNIKPGYTHSDAKYRHRDLVKAFLSIETNNTKREKIIKNISVEKAKIMNDPADIINAVIEELIARRYELPSFSALDRTVSGIRHEVNEAIFSTIFKRLKKGRTIQALKKTLVKRDGEHKSDFHRFKRLPQKPTITHFKELIDHHNWLMEFGDFAKYLHGISKIKLMQFSEEARALNAGKMQAIRNVNKKFSLIACLIAQAQCDTKDASALTFCRSIHAAEKDAIRKHDAQEKNKNETAETIAELLLEMTTEYKNKQEKKDKLLKLFEKQYTDYGGTDKVIQDCEKVLSKDNQKHIPLMWQSYRNKSKAVINFLESVNLGSIKNNESILEAVKIVIKNKQDNYAKDWVTLGEKVDLSFAPKEWLPLISTEDHKTINTRQFEICVMNQLREKLRASDVYVKDADAYGDYRQELIPWKDCLALLPEFCELAGIPHTDKDIVSVLKEKLKSKSKKVDKLFPNLKELVIDDKGVPTLKKRKSRKSSKSIIIREAIKKRMPERNLLDIMCLAQNTTEWANVFSPLSGSSSKLFNQIGATIVTTFGYGTGMGPCETSRHVRAGFNERTIALVNKSHVNLKKLNESLARIVDYYKGFPLIKNWGTGVSVAVDGTLEKIYDQNLLSEAHFRYGKKGGIAYHHISDTYIALFSSLIPCGVWEAIAIIEGLLANESKIKPKKVHGDTQAQSTPVFALSYLFGIQLLPRIRNWKGLKLYKADKRMKFKYIDSLFKDSIDWKLIENYWQDMMQIVLSVQHGKISSKVILSKLNSRNKSSQLYKAFRELGNVIRTLFLLDYISDPDFREKITAETNKVESYNKLSDWTRFATDLIVASNDTTEMEKAIKYNTLLNNMVILQNVIDMSRVIQQMRLEGWSICKEDLAGLSPYLTEHLKRFGDFILDLGVFDENVDRIKQEPLFAEVA